jgi:hypothetical protein
MLFCRANFTGFIHKETQISFSLMGLIKAHQKKETKPVGHFNICISIPGRARDLFLQQRILTCSEAHPAHLPQHGMQKEYYK